MGSYIDNLAETIKKTGFPLELEIDDVMRARGRETFPSYYYFDEEDGKQREIDNYALFPDWEDVMKALDPLGLSPHLTVECKKL